MQNDASHFTIMRTSLIILGLLSIAHLHASMIAQFAFGDHIYQVFDDAKTWTDARNDAGSRILNGVSGHLVEINSAEENTAIFNVLQANDARFTQRAGDGGDARYVWTGANDQQNEGTWVWDNSGINFWTGLGNNGSALGGNYHNWGNDNGIFEPDDFFSQDACGIALDDWPVGFSGQWNDIDTSNTMPYIVEYVPEPTQIALVFGLSALLIRWCCCLPCRRKP